MKILFFWNRDAKYNPELYPVYLEWSYKDSDNTLINFFEMAIPSLHEFITTGVRAHEPIVPLESEEYLQILEFLNLIGAEYEDRTIDSVSEES